MYAFYLFIVSFLGLLGFYFSVGSGINMATEQVFGSEFYNGSLPATFLSIAAVSGLLWFVHWRWLYGTGKQLDSSMHGTVLFHLFIVVSGFAIGLLVSGVSVLTALAELVADNSMNRLESWGHLTAAAINLLITVALWLYHLPLLRHESQIDKKQAKRISRSRTNLV